MRSVKRESNEKAFQLLLIQHSFQPVPRVTLRARWLCHCAPVREGYERYSSPDARRCRPISSLIGSVPDANSARGLTRAPPGSKHLGFNTTISQCRLGNSWNASKRWQTWGREGHVQTLEGRIGVFLVCRSFSRTYPQQRVLHSLVLNVAVAIAPLVTVYCTLFSCGHGGEAIQSNAPTQILLVYLQTTTALFSIPLPNPTLLHLGLFRRCIDPPTRESRAPCSSASTKYEAHIHSCPALEYCPHLTIALEYSITCISSRAWNR